MPAFTIAQEKPSTPEAQGLIARHLGQMSSQSPAESCHALDSSGLDGPDVRFFLLRNDDGLAIAMGALKRLADGALELKSMHTLAEARGTGAGRAMLEHLLDIARQDRATGIYLETGSTDDFVAARKLYEGYGFAACEPFEGYDHDPWSVFMCLDLTADA